MDNIVLCGFMGCGKTTVGRVLAQQTGARFVDMDAYIEQDAGMTVSAIFDRFGEADFRRRERDACRALAEQSGLIVASGGGALTFPENVKALSRTGCIVLIHVTPAVVLERLQGDTTRPLLARPDKEQAVQDLFARRLPLYRAAADIEVDGNRPAAQVARDIAAAAKTFCRHKG